MFAWYTVALRAFESDRGTPADNAAAAVAVELLPGGTNACARLRIVVEIFGAVARRLLGFAALVVDRVGQCLVFILSGKTLIAAPHVGVGDERIDFQCRQLLEVVLGVVARIGGDEAGVVDERTICFGGFDGLDHGDQQLLFAARAVRLRFDDDLVLGVDGGHACVVLYHAFGCRHLRGLVVCAVALSDCAFAALALFSVIGEPLPHFGRIVLQAGDALVLLGLEAGFVGTPIFFAVPFEHDLGRRFELGCLPLEIGVCAALRLGGVAGQLHAVDGEHLAPDQSLFVADEKYLGEDAGDLVTQCRNKAGDGGEVRPAVSGQRDEGDVFAAGALDVAAADDALRIGEQHNLQQHDGRISGGSRDVIFETRIETGQVKLVVDQVIHGMLESAGQKLPLQVNSEKPGAGVDVFVTRYLLLQIIVPHFDIDI